MMRLSKIGENKGDSGKACWRNFHLESSRCFTEIKDHIIPSFVGVLRAKMRTKQQHPWPHPVMFATYTALLLAKHEGCEQ